MKSIEVNNQRHLEITATPQGIEINHRDSRGQIEPENRETLTDGEIVMVCNLVHFMKEYGAKTAVVTLDGEPYEFRIFQ